jgi:hypothetical protein
MTLGHFVQACQVWVLAEVLALPQQDRELPKDKTGHSNRSGGRFCFPSRSGGTAVTKRRTLSGLDSGVRQLSAATGGRTLRF